MVILQYEGTAKNCPADDAEKKAQIADCISP